MVWLRVINVAETNEVILTAVDFSFGVVSNPLQRAATKRKYMH